VKGFPTYEDANSGKVLEWGIQSVITDKLLRNHLEAKDKMVEMLSSSLAKVIINNMGKVFASGKTPIYLEMERDPNLRLFEYVVVVEAVSLTEPKQYVAEAYRSWLILRDELEHWQQKSLLQFIHYWWLRKTKPLREKWAKLKYRENY
jgi:hypothetical protein